LATRDKESGGAGSNHRIIWCAPRPISHFAHCLSMLLSHCPFTACPLPIHCHELPIHVLCRTKQSHEHRRLTVPDMSQATKGHWHRGGCVLWRVEGGPSGRRPPRSGDIPDRSPGPRGRKSGPSHPRNALTTAPAAAATTARHSK
jgi:hypothetical protein